MYKIPLVTPEEMNENKDTRSEKEYKDVLNNCNLIFENKLKDYGESWRVLRPESVTDQILIKAKRIRSLQEKQKQKVNEPIQDEFKAIINYCIIAIIQLSKEKTNSLILYNEIYSECFDLFKSKNHDYGEAWREMRVSSMTDLILMKLYRIKQIEDNNGKTIVSEGLTSNYQDILNYAVFCLIVNN